MLPYHVVDSYCALMPTHSSMAPAPLHAARFATTPVPYRYMSLVGRANISSQDSQSQMIISYILIVLSILLVVSAIVECFFEVSNAKMVTMHRRAEKIKS